MNFRGAVLRSVVQHRHRNQHRQSVRQSTLENEIKARLLRLSVAIYFAMPGIGGRNIDVCLFISPSSMINRIAKSAPASERAQIDLSNRIAKPVANIC